MPEINKQFFEESIPSIDSVLHVKGQSVFTNDIPHTGDCLFAAVGWSKRAHAIIKSIDLREVIKDPEVKAIVTAEDIPGINDCAIVTPGDPIFIKEKGISNYYGQPILAVACTSRQAALKAIKKVKIKYKNLKPIIVTIKDALKKKSYISKPTVVKKGNPLKKIIEAKHRITSSFKTGAQIIYI